MSFQPSRNEIRHNPKVGKGTIGEKEQKEKGKAARG
jgi:hypothetical protein